MTEANQMLVLQWSARNASAYDELILIEDRLEAGLRDPHSIDGHDFGSGEMNIFVSTPDPRTAFAEVGRLLGDDPMWSRVRAGYRQLADDGYLPLWPVDLESISVR